MSRFIVCFVAYGDCIVLRRVKARVALVTVGEIASPWRESTLWIAADTDKVRST